MFQANMFSVQGRTVREVTLFVAVIQDRFQLKEHDFDEKFESSCWSLLQRWSFKNVIQ